MHVGVLMLGGDRCIDVSTQPGTVPTMLRREARTRREDPNRWCNGVAGALFEVATRWGFGDLPANDRGDLDAMLVSLSFPLALLARRGGAGPLPHVPRWAAPTLRAESATAAARVALGPTANRSAARALPRGMMPGDGAPAEAAPDLRPLGLAISLADHLPAERLATVLAGGGRWLPPQHWPTDDDVKQLRRLWRTVDEATATALAVDALSIERGCTRLRRSLTIIEPFVVVAELTLARRVVDLERQTAVAVPLEHPEPVPRRELRVRRAPVIAAAPAPAPAPDPLPAVPLIAPNDGPGGTDGFVYPPTIEIAHGYRLGEHRLVLPGDPVELTRWGRRLSNCLADYAGAVRSGHSVVVGLEERDTLVAALELRNGTVRQFVGIANSRPTRARRDVAERMLHDLALGGR
ncbi:MAG: PcfJ domain-containing protein [Acidimicrobiales bacterium]